MTETDRPATNQGQEFHMTKTAAHPNPMPITLQPGAAALVALMKADPDFAVDVKKGVVSEIVRRLMPKDLEEVCLGTIRAEVEKARTGLLERIVGEGKTLDEVVRERVEFTADMLRKSSYAKMLSYSDPARLKLVKAVQEAVVGVVREAVGESLGTSRDDEGDTPLQKAINARVAEMEARIAGPMAQRIEEAVARRIGIAEEAEIARRVDDRLKSIRTALAA
jgi:hypothetical protein